MAKLRRSFRVAAIGVVVGSLCIAASPTKAQPCPGDCNGDGAVSIDELVRGVGIASDRPAVDSCSSVDANGDGVVTIDELILAVGNALEGCPDDGAVIVFERPNQQPEGIEYDAAGNRFIVGSRTQGTILSVADDGTIAELVSAPGMSSTLGLHIHVPSGRLLAAGALDGTNALGLGIYDLATGAVSDVVDMSPVAVPGGHLANDVVADSAGNAYVTDTLTPGVYRVDLDGNPTLLSDSPLLRGANGIEIYDDRILLVATLFGPALVRIPLDDPAAISTVTVATQVSGDGIVFDVNGDLAVVGALTNPGMVLRLRSDDDWETATQVASWDASATGFGSPTTAAARDDEVHVIFAHLFDQSRTQYEIVRVEFE